MTKHGAVLGFVAGVMLGVFPACGPKAACDAASCATGCCDAQGVCRTGDTGAACGAGARACVSCQGAQTCQLNVCTSPSSAAPMDAGVDAGSTQPDSGVSVQGDVVINEVATSDGDFFELLNTGATTADLSGLQVADRDDATMGPKLSSALVFPAGTTLAPGARLLVIEGATAGPSTACGDATVASCFVVTFGLSAGNGDAVFLLDGAGAVLVREDVPAAAHAAKRSWGRVPDGTGAFRETARTPGLPNRLPDATDEDMDAGTTIDAGMRSAVFVVVRVGPAADGGALSSASAPVQLEWRDLFTGAVVGTVALPTSDTGTQRAFALSGSASSEGLLASSGGYWTLAGYASAPGVANVNSASGVARVVARVGNDGGLDTSTSVTDAYAGNNVRAAATVDGTSFWLGGTGAMNAGVRSVAFGSMTTSSDVYSGVTNIRAVKVAAGQLYASTASDAGAGVPRVFAVGQGLPLATTTATTPLPGVSVLLASDFLLMDRDGTAGPDTLYVVDTGNGVGVRRYTLSGSSWSETSSLHTPSTTACIGVAARALTNTGSVTVLCTATNGSIYRWEDDGAVADGGMPTSTVIAAPSGTAFRGLGF